MSTGKSTQFIDNSQAKVNANKKIFLCILTCILFFSGSKTLFAAFESLSMLKPETGYKFHSILQDSGDLEVSLLRSCRYGLPELTVNAVYAQFRFKNCTPAFFWSSSGDELYRENKFATGVARKYKFAEFGLYLNYCHLTVKNYGSASSLGLTGRLNAIIHPAIEVGLAVEDFPIMETIADRIAADMQYTGFAFVRLSEETLLSAFVQDASQTDPVYSLGVIQRLNRWIKLDIFLSDNPGSLGLGIELLSGKMSFGFRSVSQQPLGWIYEAGLTYTDRLLR